MILKNLNKSLLINISLIFLIFLLDRISKVYVINLSSDYDKLNLKITSFLNINLIWNEGIAFGLLSFGEKTYYNMISILIFLIILYILFHCYREQGISKYFYILIAGGAIGNFFDRIVYKSVPDFIDLHYKEFNWFIFNIADIFISIGIFFLIMNEIILNKKSNG